MSGPVLKAPRSLGVRGSTLWLELQGEYEFDPHEDELLLETCRALDVIDALAASIEVDGVMLIGSQGQSVLNGAVAELRQQQAAFARLASQLNLTDADLGTAISARSAASRAAAQKRWRDKKRGQRA
jgi:hypothetical protein